jgi:hypothetical protein
MGEPPSSSPTATAEPNRPIYWPFDFVAEDFPNVWILTYSDNSKLSKGLKGANTMIVSQHTTNLLQQTTDNRVECRGR